MVRSSGKYVGAGKSASALTRTLPLQNVPGIPGLFLADGEYFQHCRNHAVHQIRPSSPEFHRLNIRRSASTMLHDVEASIPASPQRWSKKPRRWIFEAVCTILHKFALLPHTGQPGAPVPVLPLARLVRSPSRTASMKSREFRSECA